MVKCVLILTSQNCSHCLAWRGNGHLVQSRSIFGQEAIQPGHHKYDTSFFRDLITQKGDLNQDYWTVLSVHVVPRNGNMISDIKEYKEICEYTLYNIEDKKGVKIGVRQRIFFPHSKTGNTLLQEKIYTDTEDVSTDPHVYDQGENWSNTVKYLIPPMNKISKFVRFLPAVIFFELEPVGDSSFFAASWGMRFSRKFPYIGEIRSKNPNQMIETGVLDFQKEIAKTEEYKNPGDDKVKMVRTFIED